MKLDLLTNATVVEDAIRFVSEKAKNEKPPVYNSSNGNESKELTYNDKKGEEKHEETDEISSTIINQTF